MQELESKIETRIKNLNTGTNKQKQSPKTESCDPQLKNWNPKIQNLEARTETGNTKWKMGPKNEKLGSQECKLLIFD